MSRRLTYTEQLDRLFDAFFEELEEIPDHGVLAGESASSVKDRALKRIERAAAEAGRRRLVAAKRDRNRHVSTLQAPITQINVAEARAYIAKAAQDSRSTLAARNLDEMSDEDVLRLYNQIRELEAEGPKRQP